MGRLSTGNKTFGRSLCIRVPRPAASTIAIELDITIPSVCLSVQVVYHPGLENFLGPHLCFQEYRATLFFGREIAAFVIVGRSSRRFSSVKNLALLFPQTQILSCHKAMAIVLLSIA